MPIRWCTDATWSSYADALGKPISRLYVTHYHPDHLLGAAAFPAPILALAEVKEKIDAVGDRVAREEHEKFPETIPLCRETERDRHARRTENDR